ncbi:hypothetical protein [Caldicellulosiruptor acetigenus]|uniref:hypothetical protein n=1 Tax=Caldicellulosiruptor acetigenus TaxID=301953 RepID=UPI000425D7B8|nr:hypothetical protein [Caldicellulosiruptor acetigenus]WAM36172.1 hypothetical protein OTK01_002563 [Caldicellulosiruptor acetigenus]
MRKKAAFVLCIFLSICLLTILYSSSTGNAQSNKTAFNISLKDALDSLNKASKVRFKQTTVITPQSYELGLLSYQEELILDRKNNQFYIISQTDDTIYFVRDKKLYIKSPADSFIICEVPENSQIYKLFFASSGLSEINPVFEKREKKIYELVLKQKTVVEETYLNTNNTKIPVYKVKVQVPAKYFEGVMKEYLKSYSLERLKILNPKYSSNDVKTWEKQLDMYLAQFKFSDLVYVYFIDKKDKNIRLIESFYTINVSNQPYLIKSLSEVLESGEKVKIPQIDENMIETLPDINIEGKGLSS